MYIPNAFVRNPGQMQRRSGNHSIAFWAVVIPTGECRRLPPDFGRMGFDPLPDNVLAALGIQIYVTVNGDDVDFSTEIETAQRDPDVSFERLGPAVQGEDNDTQGQQSLHPVPAPLVQSGWVHAVSHRIASG